MKVIVPCVWGRLFCQQCSKTYCRECNTRRHCRLPDHQFVRLIVTSGTFCFLETVWFPLTCVLIPTPICSNVFRQASQLRIFNRNFSQELWLCWLSKLARRGCESSTERNQHNCGSANRKRQKPVLSVPPFRNRRDRCGNLPYTKPHS